MKKLLLIVLSSLCYFVNAQDVLEVEYDVYTVYDASKTQGSVTIDNRKLNKDETIRYFTEQMKIPRPYILITKEMDCITKTCLKIIICTNRLALGWIELSKILFLKLIGL